MVSKTDTTTYLLRDIPKTLWAKVKSAAYDKNLTLRDWIVEAIENELKRQYRESD